MIPRDWAGRVHCRPKTIAGRAIIHRATTIAAASTGAPPVADGLPAAHFCDSTQKNAGEITHRAGEVRRARCIPLALNNLPAPHPAIGSATAVP